jgi:hypothetical protein
MLERFLDVMEIQLQKAKESEICGYRERLEAGTAAQGDEADAVLEAIAERHEQFSRFARYAFLMLTLMVFEARAKELCKYVRNGKQLSLKIGDLQGNLSEKLKTYLCRYAKVLDENWQLWGDIRELQLLRNQIAHQSGICPKEEIKKLKSQVCNVPGFRLESDVEGFCVVLNLDSCRYAVSSIKRFFMEGGRAAGFCNAD